MSIVDRLVVIRRDHGQVFVYDGPPGPRKLVESRCPDGSATDPWGNEAPTGDWRKDELELPGECGGGRSDSPTACSAAP